jgi:hypothetical protein
MVVVFLRHRLGIGSTSWQRSRAYCSAQGSKEKKVLSHAPQAMPLDSNFATEIPVCCLR